MTESLKLAVVAESAEFEPKAIALAQELNIALVSGGNSAYDFLLVVTSDGVELREGSSKDRALRIDFLKGALAYRRKHGGGYGELVARAVGVKPGKELVVLDATAGWGRDAFVLACLGCKVTMLERSPVVAALLRDGLELALADETFKNLKLELIVVDAIAFIGALQNPVDVIYLDPMFPERTKSALVKKEMRVMRALVGADLDAAALLEAALQKARNRVVVKRSRLASALQGPEPDLKFMGRSSRFDVYFTHHAD